MCALAHGQIHRLTELRRAALHRKGRYLFERKIEIVLLHHKADLLSRDVAVISALINPAVDFQCFENAKRGGGADLALFRDLVYAEALSLHAKYVQHRERTIHHLDGLRSFRVLVFQYQCAGLFHIVLPALPLAVPLLMIVAAHSFRIKVPSLNLEF